MLARHPLGGTQNCETIGRNTGIFWRYLICAVVATTCWKLSEVLR